MKILSVIFIIFIYSIYENKYYKIHNIKIKSEKVHKKVKFIQISDYHLNPFINLKSLERHINKFQADFVFLTGDFINRSTRPKDFSKYFHLKYFLLVVITRKKTIIVVYFLIF